jgi:hypothetical protein
MSSRQAIEITARPADVSAAERRELVWPGPDMPTIGPHGLLVYRGRSVCLSERNAQLAGVFIYHFNSELTDLVLLDRVWPEGVTRWTLRLCVRRLARRVQRVGLTIVEVGEHAHAMHSADDR